LADPQKRAQFNSNDVSLEDPLFVDPGKDDPIQHIGFRGETPYPVPGSPKGKQTIAALKLDRDILNDKRLRHLEIMKTLYGVIKAAENSPQNQELQQLAVEAEATLKFSMSDQGTFTSATRAAWNTQFRFVL
jgi:hypothetical protein